MKSIELQGKPDIRVRANPMRKLSCDGESRGFETDTVPFINIFGMSVLSAEGVTSCFIPVTEKAGNNAAAPVAALTRADLCKKLRRLIFFFRFESMLFCFIDKLLQECDILIPHP